MEVWKQFDNFVAIIARFHVETKRRGFGYLSGDPFQLLCERIELVKSDETRHVFLELVALLEQDGIVSWKKTWPRFIILDKEKPWTQEQKDLLDQVCNYVSQWNVEYRGK